MYRRLAPCRVSAHARRLAVVAALLVILPSVVAQPKAWAGEIEPGRHVLHGKRVQICNAIGDAQIVAGSGPNVIVEITTQGPDAGKLRVSIEECRDAEVLRIRYPGNRVVDPEMGRSENRMTVLGGCCGRDAIRFTRRGDGIEARADLVIRVPKGYKVNLGLGTGSVVAEHVDASIGIDTGSARIHVKDVTGALAIDSGSGGATISDFKGPIAIDSGSGMIEIEDLDGTLAVDSGSGRITLSHVRADNVAIDSGSGQVTGDDVIASGLAVESGSGGIDIVRVNAKTIAFESGSGEVRADLVDSPAKVRIESGSGAVTLTAPRDLDARLQISCPKRHLNLVLPVTADRVDSDYFEGRAGNGRGLIVIEAGSAGVSLRARTD